MKIPPPKWEQSCFMRTKRRADGRTNVTKIIVAFHDFCTRAITSNLLFENIATIGINKIKATNMLCIGTNTENAPYFFS
jgi:hypothetical protein